MAYKSLLDSSLSLAFNTLKDLAVDAVFSSKSGTSFDFATGAAENAVTETKIIKVVVIDTKKNSDSRSTKQRQIMFKTKDVPNSSLYDSITIDGTPWKLGTRIKDSGYVVVCDIYRE
jgi:hypothetical protein